MYCLRSGSVKNINTPEGVGSAFVPVKPVSTDDPYLPRPQSTHGAHHPDHGFGAGHVVKQEPCDVTDNHLSHYFAPNPSFQRQSETFGSLQFPAREMLHQPGPFSPAGQSWPGGSAGDVEDIVDFDAGYVVSSKLSQLVANGAYSYLPAPQKAPPHDTPTNSLQAASPPGHSSYQYPMRIKPDPDAGSPSGSFSHTSCDSACSGHTTRVVQIKSEYQSHDHTCSQPVNRAAGHVTNISASVRIKTEPEANSTTSKEDPDSSMPAVWEPPLWRVQYQNICQMRAYRTAPVDTDGCFMLAERDVPPQVRRYQVLVSLMLSSQTKDQITGKAMANLKKHGLRVENILNTPREDIAKMIHAVGFWQKKSDYIKRTTEIIASKYNSDIPDTLKELMSLPGVGPKMGNLVMDFAWGTVTGIAVDTHVHRISHRLGWMKKQTPTPEATRIALEKWLPMSEWSNLNLMLVGFGQTLCAPQRPRCGDCLNRNICPSSNACNDATMGGLAGNFCPTALTTGKKKKKSKNLETSTPIKSEPLSDTRPLPEVGVVSTPRRKRRKVVDKEPNL